MTTDRRLLRLDWRLLQNEQVVTATTAALAHAHAQVIPGNQINGLEGTGKTSVVAFAQTERIAPAPEP